jgi:hypothetical protein
MTSNQKWFAAIVLLILVSLILFINITKKLLLTITVEPNSMAEINWRTPDGLKFGGTYSDSDGDGEIEAWLPQDATRITIGRQFLEIPNISVITSDSSSELNQDVPATCPIVMTSEANGLLTTCSLPTESPKNNMYQTTTFVEGKSTNLVGVTTQHATYSLEEIPNPRLVSIEALAQDLIQNLPDYSGEGQIIGYDTLNYKVSLFSQ